MTASDWNRPDHKTPCAGSLAVDAMVQHIERTCRTVIDGRRAARMLTDWARRFSLSEPEFQLLWSLRLPTVYGNDQTTLASLLALSPAQVSASIERLRAHGWIAQQSAAGDRRRHLWQLTPNGRAMLENMLAAAVPLHSKCPRPTETNDSDSREAAA